ncbi:CRISPR-associated helicase Cas3' [Archaeoglobus neptunius]|uniref:CRISPR-associated helicase Cas3' n=1 Tax=Archaeoglobus neptunius TaxID=2798580 RepID=UPI001926F495|nr:CRISPR-associated helicase Cas3' [Archaeoglobus neptunius]
MKVCFAKFNPHDLLESHVNDVINVLKSIKTAFPWLGDIFPEIWKLSFYSALIHDIGKCAVGFQKNPKKWGYRHEILSTPFTQFLKIPEEQRMLVTLAVLTHHKTIDEIRDIVPTKEHRSEYDEKIDELFENSDYIEGIFMPKVPFWEAYFFSTRNPPYLFHFPANWKKKVREFDFWQVVSWYEKYWRDRKVELILLRGLLNATDHLASAGEISVQVLPSIVETLELKLPRQNWRPKQKEAWRTDGNLILRAPTGYGKTEAALLWAERNSFRVNNDITSRIFYILPYKASINAMHSRILSLFYDPSLVGVLHSTSKFYLYSSALEYKRLSSLYQKIYTPLKVTTPFQIMKSFFGVGFFEMSFTELIGSLLIFDEIHAYEPNVLGIILAILEALKDYKTKSLVMTATLPDFLEKLIKDVLSPKEVNVSDDEVINSRDTE